MAKVLISVDDALLERIDRAARAANLSRSAYLARLAERETSSTTARAERMRDRAFASLDRLFEKAPSGDATSDVRALRDER